MSEPEGLPPGHIPPRPGLRPWVVGLMGLLLPGLGHLWIGQGVKGTALLVGGFVTCWGLGLLNLLCAWDGYVMARRLAQGHAIHRFESSWLGRVLDALGR